MAARIAKLAQGLTENGAAVLDDNQSLSAWGLSSLQIVRLIMRVEDEFGVAFHGDDIAPANFETVKTISTLVEQMIAR